MYNYHNCKPKVIANKDLFTLAVTWFLHIPNPKEGIFKLNARLTQIFSAVPREELLGYSCPLSSHEFTHLSLVYSHRARKTKSASLLLLFRGSDLSELLLTLSQLLLHQLYHGGHCADAQ